MLAIPLYEERNVREKVEDPGKPGKFTSVTGKQKVAINFYCLIYQGQDKVLTDLIYSYNSSLEFQPSIAEDLLTQIGFKAVLDMTIMNKRDFDKFQKFIVDDQKKDYLK